MNNMMIRVSSHQRPVNGPTLPNPLIYSNGLARYWPNHLLIQPIIDPF